MKSFKEELEAITIDFLHRITSRKFLLVVFVMLVLLLDSKGVIHVGQEELRLLFGAVVTFVVTEGFVDSKQF